MFNFDPGMAIWTLLTFLVVLFVLSRFVVPPVAKMLDDRAKRIESDLAVAESAAESARKTSTELTQRLAKVDLERERILSETHEEAKLRRDKLERETLDRMAELRRQKETELVAESDRFLADSGFRINELIIAGCERILRTGLTHEQQARILEDRICEFEKIKKI